MRQCNVQLQKARVTYCITVLALALLIRAMLYYIVHSPKKSKSTTQMQSVNASQSLITSPLPNFSANVWSKLWEHFLGSIAFL